MKPIQRRHFLKTMGLSTLGITSGMSLLPNLASGATIPLDYQKIKITGMKTMVIDNIPPYAGQRKWLIIQIETDNKAMFEKIDKKLDQMIDIIHQYQLNKD